MLVEVGAVPAVGVDVERVEDAGLEWVAAGDELDGAAVGVEGDVTDAVEFAQRSLGAEVLVGFVRVADVGVAKAVADERFEDAGVDACGDVPTDAFIGPVSDWA